MTRKENTIKSLLPAATLLVRKGVGPDSGTRFSSVRTRQAWIGGRRPLPLMSEVHEKGNNMRHDRYTATRL